MTGPSRRGLLLGAVAAALVPWSACGEAPRSGWTTDVGVSRDTLARFADAWRVSVGPVPALDVLAQDLFGGTVPAGRDEALERRLVARVREDFTEGRVVEVGGWVLARTEAHVALYVHAVDRGA